MAATTIRSAFRSTTSSFRAAAPRLASQPKPKPTASAFQLPKQKPLSQRIFLRSPVELSSCVDSLMPFHSATSSALLTSMLSVSRCACWLPEDCNDGA